MRGEGETSQETHRQQETKDQFSSKAKNSGSFQYALATHTSPVTATCETNDQWQASQSQREKANKGMLPNTTEND
jgi:PBP1b-binding outer membrane lipoprotein LpoB|tara:strand:- start:414 stop:638 length:225 start_codon:yes stop_codon:yes gene_type:complete